MTFFGQKNQNPLSAPVGAAGGAAGEATAAPFFSEKKIDSKDIILEVEAALTVGMVRLTIGDRSSGGVAMKLGLNIDGASHLMALLAIAIAAVKDVPMPPKNP